jgi:YegS/Rv2252/BmrU family lipid kinase
MPSRALLILNPRSRKGAEAASQARSCLLELGLELVPDSTETRGSPGELIARHAGEVDRVIVGGGDGTLNAVVQELVGRKLPLGILPLGTANNLARTLGVPLRLPDACEIGVRGFRRKIDLGWVNGRYYFTTASIGLSVRITQALTHTAKRRWGPLAYAVAAARTLVRSRAFHADITWPGGARHTRTVQIVIGNGRYYGGALPVAEDATIDDAQLDLYSLEVRHWLELLTLVPALRRGRHGSKESVEALRAPEFQITTVVPREINVDGEICSTTPAQFRVVPAALEVLGPLKSQE